MTTTIEVTDTLLKCLRDIQQLTARSDDLVSSYQAGSLVSGEFSAQFKVIDDALELARFDLAIVVRLAVVAAGIEL